MSHFYTVNLSDLTKLNKRWTLQKKLVIILSRQPPSKARVIQGYYIYFITLIKTTLYELRFSVFQKLNNCLLFIKFQYKLELISKFNLQFAHIWGTVHVVMYVRIYTLYNKQSKITYFERRTLYYAAITFCIVSIFIEIYAPQVFWDLYEVLDGIFWKTVSQTREHRVTIFVMVGWVSIPKAALNYFCVPLWQRGQSKAEKISLLYRKGGSSRLLSFAKVCQF